MWQERESHLVIDLSRGTFIDREAREWKRKYLRKNTKEIWLKWSISNLFLARVVTRWIPLFAVHLTIQNDDAKNAEKTNIIIKCYNVKRV